jgi:tetratricopeptide (TPR) repeat protein
MIYAQYRVIRRYWLIVALGLFLNSCDFSDKKGNDPEKILHSPPYAGLTDSIAQFPNDARLYAARGLRLSQNDHHEMATPDYKKAWELNQVEGMAQEYVNNLLLVNKPREAITLLRECITKWPQSIDLRRRLSEIYEQVGQHARAIALYDEILGHDSLNFEAWYNKGILLSRLKDTAGAIDALERSYAAQPIYYNGITLAGFYATKRNPKTTKLCDELIAKDVNGEFPDAHFVKGLFYSYTKQYDSADAMFNESIRRDWRFADAHVEKAIIQYEKKQYEEALKILKTALTVANTNPDAYYWIGRCYEASGDKELALMNYERALSLDPDYDEARAGIRKLKS